MANDTARPKFKRRQYIISPAFQFRYIGIILLLMFLTAALCSYIVYYTAVLTMGEKLASVYPQGRLVALIQSVNFRILVSIVLVTPLVAVIGIFLSHKIAGPIYRIEKYLQSLAAGDFSKPLTLRQGDELVTLADGINNLVDSLKSTVVGQKDRLDKISREVSDLKKLIESNPREISVIRENIGRIDAEIRQLTHELAMYKL